MLPDFEGIWAEEPPQVDQRARRRRDLLAYGLQRRLTARQRQMVQAYYYQGKTLQQIAQETGLSPSTVCRHLQAARRRLVELARQEEELRRALPPGEED